MRVHLDFDEFLFLLNENNVQYVIIEAFALAFHGQPRATGDIDIWIRPTTKNAKASLNALHEFGFGELDISEEDLLSGKIIQLGYPPVRIVLITTLDGLTKEEIWNTCEAGRFGEHDVFYIGKDAFIKNKLSTGRHKDLADIEMLGENP